VDPSFDLDAAVCSTVAAIAERLDGLPLAIELAAARIQFLTPSDLLARLDRRLTLLTNGFSDVDERHQTMRDAIAWSYDLLPADEQMLFQRLGVFVGGFTLDAVAEVAEVDRVAATNAVESLLRQNLVYRPVTVDSARYAMLELTREYALELLDAAGEGERTRKLHARFYRQLASEIEPELATEPGGRGRRRLERECVLEPGSL
jgi:predicted ATPase